MAKNNDDGSKKPKKQRKPRVPKDQQAIPELQIDQPDARAIADLIEDSLDHKLEESRRKQSRKELCDAIVCTMQEYYRNFIIIGFDLSNEPLVVSRAMTPLDGEALTGLMKKFYADWSKSH